VPVPNYNKNQSKPYLKVAAKTISKMAQNMMQQNNLSRVSINELSAKMKSKKELYNFLLQDCAAYLPLMLSKNVFFLK